MAESLDYNLQCGYYISMETNITIKQGHWTQQSLTNAKVGDIIKLNNNSFAKVISNRKARYEGTDNTVVIAATPCEAAKLERFEIQVKGQSLEVFERDGAFYRAGWEKSEYAQPLRFKEDNTVVTRNDSRVTSIVSKPATSWDLSE